MNGEELYNIYRDKRADHVGLGSQDWDDLDEVMQEMWTAIAEDVNTRALL